MLITLNSIFVALFLLGAFYFWRQTAKLKSKVTSVEPTSPTDEVVASDGTVTSPYSLISISVPKNNDRTPQAAEQLFAALHGIFRAAAADQPQVSFEIASKNQVIFFYIYMPTELKDFVLSQVYAQYPNVEVKNIPITEDYAHISDSSSIAATELALKKPSAYPVKTFQNFEVDPLSGITAVLSSVGQDEELWFQMIVRPISDEWQEQGDKEVKNIKEPPKKPKGFLEILKNELIAIVYDIGRVIFTGSPGEAKKEEKKDEKKELPGGVQQAIKGIEEKTTKLGFETTIRLVAANKSEAFAQAKLEQLIGAFKQFNSLSLNSFVSKEVSNDRAAVELYRLRAIGKPEMIFNITELASLYHFPSETVATPTIAWAGSKKGEPPANLPILGSVPADELTVFAQTNYREHVRKFGIKKKDRRLHMYIIGKTGTGKSTLMENMIYDDIREGRGVAVVDPHGELIDHVLEFIPESRVNDVVYFSPADYDHPVGFNVLEYVNPDMRNVVASGVVGIFKKIFGESWGPRLEYILRNAILALLEYPNSTLLGVMRILTDNAYRRQVISYVNDPVIKDFFVNEYEKYDPKFRQEAINPIQNKVGQFLSSSTIRNIVGQPQSSMDIRKIMDEGKILLADLSTGKIGEDNSALLGSMLITKIQLSAMGRTNIPEDERRDFYLYVDEFQNFATDSFATILSEARKYRLNLVMINQYISQMPETVANAVFGNVGTMISFRVGASDGDKLKQEFEPVFDVNDLVNLPNRQIYLKMAIDGVTVPAFSASTLPPPEEKSLLRNEVIEASRSQFTTPRRDVEDYIAEWSAPIDLSHDQSSKNSESDRIVTKKVDGPVAADEQGVALQVPEPVKTNASRGVEAKIEIKPENITGQKIEIINDRFNRRWYSVTPRKEVGESEPEKEIAAVEQPDDSATLSLPIPAEGGDGVRGSDGTHLTLPAEVIAAADAAQSEETWPDEDTQPESREVGEKSENNHLITWDKADELGLKMDQKHVDASKRPDDEFLPIDEL